MNDSDLYLLSSRGTLVCREAVIGGLCQRPIGDATAVALPLGRPDHAVRRDDRMDLSLTEGDWAGFRIATADDGRSFRVSRDALCLSVDPRSDRVVLAEAQSSAQQCFLLVSGAELRVLRDVLNGDWLAGASGELVTRGRSSLQADFTLRCGGLAFDLRWQLPLDLQQWPLRLVLLRDGWRIEPLIRYRPLVYYAAFGSSDIMRQFALSVQSLYSAGRYAGAVAVLTDKSEEEIGALLPPELAGRVTVLPRIAADRIGYMSARYSIIDWAAAWNHQPLLYVDTDIMFDRDVAPLLRRTALAERIAAPMEQAQSLRTSSFVGSDLFIADNCTMGEGNGINSGTFAVPNLVDHGGAFALIGRILSNFAALNGRATLGWVDQEVANYVSYRVAQFDPTWIGQYVRLASTNADPAEGRGLVHFCWVPGAGLRVQVMEYYLQRLIAGMGTSRY